MKCIFHLSLMVIFSLKIAHSIDTTDDVSPSTRYVYIVVPGQGNFGGTKHDDKLPRTIPAHYKEVVRLKTPHSKSDTFFCNKDDFGQQNCQDLLHEKLDELFLQANIKFIIHAYSQGTASILKYISDLETQDAELSINEKRTSKIEALILESAMISGFSAINHFTSNHFRYFGVPAGWLCSQLPYSDRWIPLLAQKTTFPSFQVHGTQTIEILDNIPNTFLIVILHTPQDYVLPYHGGLAMYQVLRKHNAKNLYFIPVDRNIHIDVTSDHIQHKEKPGDFMLLQSKGNEALTAIINILKQHSIYDFKQEEKKSVEDLSVFQPKFDRNYAKKHLAHVANTRLFYNTLVSAATAVKNFAPVMTFLALSYTHYRAQR